MCTHKVTLKIQKYIQRWRLSLTTVRWACSVVPPINKPEHKLPTAQSSTKSWPLRSTVRGKTLVFTHEWHARHARHARTIEGLFPIFPEAEYQNRLIWKAGCHPGWFTNSPASQRWKKISLFNSRKKASLPSALEDCHCESGYDIIYGIGFCCFDEQLAVKVFIKLALRNLIGKLRFLCYLINLFLRFAVLYPEKWKQREVDELCT